MNEISPELRAVAERIRLEAGPRGAQGIYTFEPSHEMAGQELIFVRISMQGEIKARTQATLCRALDLLLGSYGVSYAELAQRVARYGAVPLLVALSEPPLAAQAVELRLEPSRVLVVVQEGRVATEAAAVVGDQLTILSVPHWQRVSRIASPADLVSAADRTRVRGRTLRLSQAQMRLA